MLPKQPKAASPFIKNVLSHIQKNQRTHFATAREAVMVRWKKTKQCPECGKKVQKDEVEQMSSQNGSSYSLKLRLEKISKPNKTI